MTLLLLRELKWDLTGPLDSEDPRLCMPFFPPTILLRLRVPVHSASSVLKNITIYPKEGILTPKEIIDTLTSFYKTPLRSTDLRDLRLIIQEEGTEKEHADLCALLNRYGTNIQWLHLLGERTHFDGIYLERGDTNGPIQRDGLLVLDMRRAKEQEEHNNNVVV
jgi:hypothetical protein